MSAVRIDSVARSASRVSDVVPQTATIVKSEPVVSALLALSWLTTCVWILIPAKMEEVAVWSDSGRSCVKCEKGRYLESRINSCLGCPERCDSCTRKLLGGFIIKIYRKCMRFNISIGGG